MSGIVDTKNALDVVASLQELITKIGPYTPEVKSLTIDYLNHNAVLKLLITVPASLKRNLRDIEIPAYQGYRIDEVFDGESLNRLDLPWTLKGSKWALDAKHLPSSEKYFVILKGQVSQTALDQIVRVFCPEDPQRSDEMDKYWINSAIKDMSILEKIYSELSIERVSTCVKVGVQRSFSSSIPRSVRNWLEARARADAAMDSTDRQRFFKEWVRYRAARRRVGQIAVPEVMGAVRKIFTPEVFVIFIQVDQPYRLEGITHLGHYGMIPDSIGVDVQTDLNFRIPAAQGNLIFRKRDFSQRVGKEFEEVLSKKDK